MTNLMCSVKNCMHNCNHMCEMNAIDVKGKNADSVDDTCCSTFRKEEGMTTRNSTKDVQKETHVGCNATTCKYNKESLCYAEHIDIHGAGANDSLQTACATFVRA